MVLGRSWADLGPVLGAQEVQNRSLAQGGAHILKNDVFEAKSSQDRSWGDLGSIWVAKRGRLGRPLEGQVGSKKGRKSDAKKGLVLAWSWGGVDSIGVGSLWPRSNKGETGASGPPSKPQSHVFVFVQAFSWL